MDAIYVGIDVSKDRLDVHAHPSGKAFAVARNGEGLAQLVARLQELAPVLIAVEATGGIETVVATSLASTGLPVVVANPAQVRHYAQALAKRAKTDPIDASVIARFVEATRPQVRVLPDAATQLETSKNQWANQRWLGSIGHVALGARAWSIGRRGSLISTSDWRIFRPRATIWSA